VTDLVTRNDVELAPTIEVRDWTNLDVERVCSVVEAYGNGTLMTRDEFIDNLDIEAAMKERNYINWAKSGIGPYAEKLAPKKVNGVSVLRLSDFEETWRIVTAALNTEVDDA